MIELPDHPWFVASQFHPEFRSRPTRPHPLFRDFIGAATAFADGRDRAAAAPVPAPGVRSGGIPAHRNGGEHAPAAPTQPERAAGPAVPRVPIVDANPRPDPADRFAAPAQAPPAQAPPAQAAPERPAVPTVDLRGDDLADPVGHDDDPSVPAGPVPAGEPGRP
jgi:glutamine amidotransferase class I